MKPRCYVAMPYGIKMSHDNIAINFEEVYCTLIYPAATRAICQFDVIRLEEFISNSPIVDTAVQLITDSPLMICDITSNSPNVLYELGIRHTSVPGGTLIIREQGHHATPSYLANFFIHFYRYPAFDTDLSHEIASLAGAIDKIYFDKTSNQVYRKVRYSKYYKEYHEK